MTDKEEIIIDGVCVSGCVHKGTNGLTDHKITYCREFTNNCKDNPNCYYKQLQRKEQECEELEKQNKQLEYELENMQGFDLLQELKEDLNNYERWLSNRQNECTYLVQSVNKYKQALSDIGEIAKKGLSPICYKSNCQNCSCYEHHDFEKKLSGLINEYINSDCEFNDEYGTFYEELTGFIDAERQRCNRAIPISEQILQKVKEVQQ